MITRCKFLCFEKKENTGGCWHLSFSAVTNDSEENKEFWKYTPTGQLVFQTINQKSAAMFQVGKMYYLDLLPAE